MAVRKRKYGLTSFFSMTTRHQKQNDAQHLEYQGKWGISVFEKSQRLNRVNFVIFIQPV